MNLAISIFLLKIKDPLLNHELDISQFLWFSLLNDKCKKNKIDLGQSPNHNHHIHGKEEIHINQ